MSGAGNYCCTDSALPQSAAGAGPRGSTGLGEWRGWGPWGGGIPLHGDIHPGNSCKHICLSVSISKSISKSITVDLNYYLPTYPPTYQPTYLPTCLATYLSVHLHFNASVFSLMYMQFFCLPVYLPLD